MSDGYMEQMASRRKRRRRIAWRVIAGAAVLGFVIWGPGWMIDRAHKSAVACSNAAALPEIVGDAARLFDPTDPAALAEAVRDVLAAPGEWSRRGLERAAGFSWDATARAHEAVYREASTRS